MKTVDVERDPATAPTQSMLEDLLFGVLRRGGLPAPVRQYEVAGVRFTFFHLTRRARYVVDSVLRELVVACPA